MLWWRRCLVLVPVLSFLGTTILLSSGRTPTASAFPFSLSSVVICSGSPPVPTPTPKPTKTRTPTPTPTPACVPAEAQTAPVGGAIQLNAQGTYLGSKKKKPKFRDITNRTTTAWLDLPANVVAYVGNGQYLGVAQGCSCVQVRVAGLLSQTVSVAIGSPSPACTPCPSPSP